MTKTEREKLEAIREQLERVRADAPTRSTYRAGRTDQSIEARVLDVIRELDVLLGEASDG